MDFSSVFRTHDFLRMRRFLMASRRRGGVFTLERALPETDGLAAVVTVHGREMTVSVVELPDRVPYALFEVESAEGAFVDRVRQEAENLVRDVVENCFFDSDVRSRLLSYVKERYGTEQENPPGDLQGLLHAPRARDEEMVRAFHAHSVDVAPCGEEGHDGGPECEGGSGGNPAADRS